MHIVPALVVICIPLAFAVEVDDISFDLEIIKHQPCSQGAKAKWTKKLEFEGGSDKVGPKLEPIPDKPNCFTIGGKVEVLHDFKGEFSIYIEIRNSASKKSVPENCVKQDANGCGGFGSCLYCNACKALGQSAAVEAKLLLDDEPVTCADGLNKGTYNNLKLAFCMPNIEEILKSQGLTKETFVQLIAGDDGQSLHTMGIFATVYVFDSDVSNLMATQQRIINIYKKTKKSLFKDESLPADVHWSLPFNLMIKNQQVYVACHKIFGNLKIQKH